MRSGRYRGAALLFLLAFAAALFAGGVPARIEQAQTSALQSSLAQSNVLAHSVLATMEYGAPSIGAAPTDPLARFAVDPDAVAREATSFAAKLPAGAGGEPAQAWGDEHVVGLTPIPSRQPSRLDLQFRTSLDAHARLLSGREPSGVSAAPHGPEIFEVALTSAMARFYGAHVGSVLMAPAQLSAPAYGFRVTGILAPTDPDSAFWTFDPSLATPQLNIDPMHGDWYATAALIGPDELPALDGIMGPDGKLDAVDVTFCAPLDVSGYTAASAGALLNALTAFDSGAVPSDLGLQSAAGPIDVLGQFQAQRTTVDSVLSLLMPGVAAAAAVSILLCVRLVIGRRRAHFALQRARGQSLLQLSGQVLAGLCPPMIVVLAAAFAAVRLSVPAAAWTGTSTALFAAVAAVSLLGPTAVALHEHRGRASLIGTGRGDTVRRRRSARRWVFELALFALAAGAVAQLRQQGLGSQGTNMLGALAPILVAGAATVVAVRCYPLLLRPAERAAARHGGPVSFLGLAGAARTPLSLALPSFALVLTVTLAALGAMMQHTVDAGREQAAWQQAGTDVTIDLKAETSWSAATSQASSIAKVPGVTHVALVSTQPDSDEPPGEVVAVDPDQYAAVAADTPWPVTIRLPEHPVPGYVPVLVSESTGYALDTEFIVSPEYSPQFKARVVGVVPQSAAVPAPSADSTEPLIVMPYWAVAGNAQDWPVEQIMASGTGIDEQALNAAAARIPGGATVATRAAALRALAEQPMANMVRLGYVVGLLAAAAFGICAVLISLAISAAARLRRLRLLATLGVTGRQTRRIGLLETVPLAAVTALGGLLAAVVLPPAFGSSLDLSAFTGLPSGGTALGFEAAVPLLAAAAALVLTAGAVAVQSALAARRGSAARIRELRIGDGA